MTAKRILSTAAVTILTGLAASPSARAAIIITITDAGGTLAQVTVSGLVDFSGATLTGSGTFADGPYVGSTGAGGLNLTNYNLDGGYIGFDFSNSPSAAGTWDVAPPTFGSPLTSTPTVGAPTFIQIIGAASASPTRFWFIGSSEATVHDMSDSFVVDLGATHASLFAAPPSTHIFTIAGATDDNLKTTVHIGVVPEPASSLLCVLGTAGLLLRRRRSRSERCRSNSTNVSHLPNFSEP